MIITHSPSHAQASVCQRSALASVKTASDPFHGTDGAAREALGRWGGRRLGGVLHFWRTNWSMNSFCSDSTLRRASYSMRYLKHTQRRSHPTLRGRVWTPISHTNSVYRSCCSFFSAISAWSCCCWASRSFATVFSRFRAPIASMEIKENGDLFGNISNKPHEPPKSQQSVKKSVAWSAEWLPKSPKTVLKEPLFCEHDRNMMTSAGSLHTFIFSVSTSLVISSFTSIRPSTIFWYWLISARESRYLWFWRIPHVQQCRKKL